LRHSFDLFDSSVVELASLLYFSVTRQYG
jgi:hypothetical protein